MYSSRCGCANDVFRGDLRDWREEGGGRVAPDDDEEIALCRVIRSYSIQEFGAHDVGLQVCRPYCAYWRSKILLVAFRTPVMRTLCSRANVELTRLTPSAQYLFISIASSSRQWTPMMRSHFHGGLTSSQNRRPGRTKYGQARSNLPQGKLRHPPNLKTQPSIPTKQPQSCATFRSVLFS
jgi:hypothetical protein